MAVALTSNLFLLIFIFFYERADIAESDRGIGRQRHVDIKETGEGRGVKKPRFQVKEARTCNISVTMQDRHTSWLGRCKTDTRRGWDDARQPHFVAGRCKTRGWDDARQTHVVAGTMQDRHTSWLGRCKTDTRRGWDDARQTHFVAGTMQDRHTSWLGRCKTHVVAGRCKTDTLRGWDDFVAGTMQDRHTSWLGQQQASQKNPVSPHVHPPPPSPSPLAVAVETVLILA